MDLLILVEILCRWVLGLQLIFAGLNGFFHWKSFSKNEMPFENFLHACDETRFLMPSVKIAELIFGLILLTGTATLFALAGLAPIVFVVAGLHLLYNRKPWDVLLPFVAPYVFLLGLDFRLITMLFH